MTISMDSTDPQDYGHRDGEHERIRMMREAYAVVWYELCVALALRSGSVASFAGRSARGANLYRIVEKDRSPRIHMVYFFAGERRFSCTCQPVAERHLPCAHVGATVLYLQAAVH